MSSKHHASSATPEDEERISTEEASELLGEWGKTLSDEEIQRALDFLYFISAKVYDDYITKRKSGKR